MKDVKFKTPFSIKNDEEEKSISDYSDIISFAGGVVATLAGFKIADTIGRVISDKRMDNYIKSDEYQEENRLLHERYMKHLREDGEEAADEDITNVIKDTVDEVAAEREARESEVESLNDEPFQKKARKGRKARKSR
jgi:hypothetical protein